MSDDLPAIYVPAVIDETHIPSLISRAAASLMSARNSAELLEARELAQVAYDAAKSAGRLYRVRKAHDEVIAAVHRAGGCVVD